MTRLGVESDLLSDVEIGACVWSRTIKDAAGNPAGGPVVNVYLTEDGTLEFAVLRRRQGGDFYKHVFDGDDIDMQHTTFYGRDASKAADSLHAWLGDRRQKNMDRTEKAEWSIVAAELDIAGGSGQWLPRAHARYRKRFDDRKAAS